MNNELLQHYVSGAVDRGESPAVKSIMEDGQLMLMYEQTKSALQCSVVEQVTIEIDLEACLDD